MLTELVAHAAVIWLSVAGGLYGLWTLTGLMPRRGRALGATVAASISAAVTIIVLLLTGSAA